MRNRTSGATRGQPDGCADNWNVFSLCRMPVLAYGVGEPPPTAQHPRPHREAHRDQHQLADVRGPGVRRPAGAAPAHPGRRGRAGRPRAASSRCRCGPSPSAPTSRWARSTATSPPRSTCSSRRSASSSSRPTRRCDRKPIPGDTAADRVMFVLGRTTRDLQREPEPHRGADPRVHVRRRVGRQRDPRRRGARHPDADGRDAQPARRRRPPADRGGARDHQGDRRRVAGQPGAVGHRPGLRRTTSAPRSTSRSACCCADRAPIAWRRAHRPLRVPRPPGAFDGLGLARRAGPRRDVHARVPTACTTPPAP